MGLRAWGLGFGVQGSGFRVRVYGLWNSEWVPSTADIGLGNFQWVLTRADIRFLKR